MSKPKTVTVLKGDKRFTADLHAGMLREDCLANFLLCKNSCLVLWWREERLLFTVRFL